VSKSAQDEITKKEAMNSGSNQKDSEADGGLALGLVQEGNGFLGRKQGGETPLRLQKRDALYDRILSGSQEGSPRLNQPLDKNCAKYKRRREPPLVFLFLFCVVYAPFCDHTMGLIYKAVVVLLTSLLSPKEKVFFNSSRRGTPFLEASRIQHREQ